LNIKKKNHTQLKEFDTTCGIPVNTQCGG